jgi:hypothetical protein
LKAFAKHVFKAHHIKKVAEAYNIKLTKDPPSSFACDVSMVYCIIDSVSCSRLSPAFSSTSWQLLNQQQRVHNSLIYYNEFITLN